MRNTFRFALAVLASVAAPGSVLAQEFPSKSVRLIVAGAPGTAPDIVARFELELVGGGANGV